MGLNGLLLLLRVEEKKFNYLAAGYFFPFSRSPAGNDNDGHGFSTIAINISSLRGRRLRTSPNIIYFRVLLSISSHSCRSLLRYGFLVSSCFGHSQQKWGHSVLSVFIRSYSPNLLVSLLLSASMFSCSIKNSKSSMSRVEGWQSESLWLQWTTMLLFWSLRGLFDQMFKDPETAAAM